MADPTTDADRPPARRNRRDPSRAPRRQRRMAAPDRVRDDGRAGLQLRADRRRRRSARVQHSRSTLAGLGRPGRRRVLDGDRRVRLGAEPERVDARRGRGRAARAQAQRRRRARRADPDVRRARGRPRPGRAGRPAAVARPRPGAADPRAGGARRRPESAAQPVDRGVLVAAVSSASARFIPAAAVPARGGDRHASDLGACCRASSALFACAGATRRRASRSRDWCFAGTAASCAGLLAAAARDLRRRVARSTAAVG